MQVIVKLILIKGYTFTHSFQFSIMKKYIHSAVENTDTAIVTIITATTTTISITFQSCLTCQFL